MRLQQQQRSQRSTRSRRLSELSKQLTQRIFLLFFGSCYRGGYCSGLTDVVTVYSTERAFAAVKSDCDYFNFS